MPTWTSRSAALALILGLLLVGAARAQTPAASPSPSPAPQPKLTQAEWGVFRDLVELWHARRCQPKPDLGPGVLTPLYPGVCSLHKLTLDQVDSIRERAVQELDFSMEECMALDDLHLRLKGLPAEATKEQWDQVHTEVADDYEMTVDRLHDLEFSDEQIGF